MTVSNKQFSLRQNSKRAIASRPYVHGSDVQQLTFYSEFFLLNSSQPAYEALRERLKGMDTANENREICDIAGEDTRATQSDKGLKGTAIQMWSTGMGGGGTRQRGGGHARNCSRRERGRRGGGSSWAAVERGRENGAVTGAEGNEIPAEHLAESTTLASGTGGRGRDRAGGTGPGENGVDLFTRYAPFSLLNAPNSSSRDTWVIMDDASI